MSVTLLYSLLLVDDCVKRFRYVHHTAMILLVAKFQFNSMKPNHRIISTDLLLILQSANNNFAGTFFVLVRSTGAVARCNNLSNPVPKGMGMPIMMHSLTPTMASVRP